MMHQAKQRWKAWYATLKDAPAPLDPGLWDVLLGDNWDVALVEKGGDIFGAMPYALNHHWGFKMIVPPPLIPYQGPWLSFPAGQKQARRLRFIQASVDQLIAQLPKVAHFHQHLLPGIEAGYPFHVAGYQLFTRYTYQMDDLFDSAALWEGFRNNIRQAIKKATGQFSLSITQDIDALYALKVADYKAKGKQYPISRETLTAAYQYFAEKGSSLLLIAKDPTDTPAGLLWLVWDNSTVYYWSGGVMPDFRTSGALSALLWEGMQHFSGHHKSFNFEGSMVPSIARYFMAFGPRQVPYLSIVKTRHPLLRWWYHR